MRIALAIDAEVPFDAAHQSGVREVAAPDERDAATLGLEPPRLGVKRAADLLGLDDARFEALLWFAFTVHVRRLLPVEQHLEGARLGDVEVVAGEDAEARAAAERGADVGRDDDEAALLDEGGEDRDLACGVEERKDVAGERIGLAAGRERLGAEVVALARDDVADAAARIVDVAAVARDDVDVEVHHRLAGGRAGVQADVVAVGMKLAVELAFDDVDEVEDGGALLGGGGEPVGDDAAGDDECVAGRDREAVANGEGVGVRSDPLHLGDREEDGHAQDPCTWSRGAARAPCRPPRRANVGPLDWTRDRGARPEPVSSRQDLSSRFCRFTNKRVLVSHCVVGILSDWPGGVVDGARRLLGKASARGLLQRKWSLGELELDDDDYRTLLITFEQLGPRSLREHDTGTVVTELSITKRACFGLVFLAFATEVARREARGRSLWPFVWERVRSGTRTTLLPGGQPSQDLCAAVTAACRELTLRHSIDEPETDRWYMTVWLQYGISLREASDVVDWIDGAGSRHALRLLTTSGSEHYSESLARALAVVRQYRRRATSLDAARRAVRSAGWNIGACWPALEKALQKPRSVHSESLAGSETAATAAPISWRLSWEANRDPSLHLAIDFSEVALDEKVIDVFVAGERVARWIRGSSNPELILEPTQDEPAVELRAKTGQRLADWSFSLTSEGTTISLVDTSGRPLAPVQPSRTNAVLIAPDGAKLEAPAWVTERRAWGATLAFIANGQGRPGDVIRFAGSVVWEYGAPPPAGSRALPLPRSLELRGSSGGRVALGKEVVLEREQLGGARLVLGNMPFEPKGVLAGLQWLGRVTPSRWLRLGAANGIGYGEPLYVVASEVPWRMDARREVIAKAVIDHGIIKDAEALLSGRRLTLCRDFLDGSIPEKWHCLVWTSAGTLVNVGADRMRVRSSRAIDIAVPDAAQARAVGLFHGEEWLGSWWSPDWSSRALEQPREAFVAVRVLHLPFLAEEHREDVTGWLQRALVDGLRAWLLPRTEHPATDGVSAPRDEAWLAAVRALVWKLPFGPAAMNDRALRSSLGTLDVEGVHPALEVIRSAQALVNLDHIHASEFLWEYDAHIDVFQRKLLRCLDNAKPKDVLSRRQALLRECIDVLELDEQAVHEWAFRDDDAAAIAARWPRVRLFGTIARAGSKGDRRSLVAASSARGRTG